MAVVSKPLFTSKYAENAQTTQYTAPIGTRTIIDKFTGYNGTAGPLYLLVNIVASGGAAAATNLIVGKAIGTLETYTFPELVGHVLEPGGFVSTLAGAATSIVIRASGREVS